MSNNKDFKVKNGIKPTVYHEAVGTVVSGSVGYNLAGASYDSKSFSATQSTQMYGMFFKPDGTKMYLADQIGNAAFQYSLGTAWDISTASYDSVSFNMGSQDGSPGGLFFKSDGTTMWMIGLANSGDIFEYTLSTAWDISTASYASVTFATDAKETGPYDLWFKTDGTKMYIVGVISDQIHEYNLGTAWDISTATFNQSLNPSINNPNSIEFTTDGLQMYLCSSSTELVHKFVLTTAWDISTASQIETFDVSSQDSAPFKVKLKSDGTKMYVLGSDTDDVYQYSTTLTTNTLDLSTGSVFEITPSSDIQVSLSNPAASGTVSGATLLLSASGTEYTITYDTAIQWAGGTAPTSPAIGETDVVTFSTRDGGTTYSAALAIDGAQ